MAEARPLQNDYRLKLDGLLMWLDKISRQSGKAPTVYDLEEAVGVHERTVRRLLRDLIGHGEVRYSVQKNRMKAYYLTPKAERVLRVG